MDKKQPIYLSLLTCPNFHFLVSESIQISNWCESDALTNWLVCWLLVCWPSRFDNSTVPTWGFLVSLVCRVLWFQCTLASLLPTHKFWVSVGGWWCFITQLISMAMVLLVICILMNSTTTLGTKFKLISNPLPDTMWCISEVTVSSLSDVVS